jgi:hypothetical protein
MLSPRDAADLVPVWGARPRGFTTESEGLLLNQAGPWTRC